ncbi:phosphatase PAP2 family protein [Mumia zhuanghuii]|uniref:Phosphatase PAP2 family protein n=2 Tax=Mumia TaxID=1546255 RepID=A0ABW1QL28_9ACTN|nr:MULTISPECIES: phosphatase PAP2 family protein [Mumia]KAA1418324.1 phosphatase PAP2 family protein [Mumia zhuanghuii]
MAKGVQGGSARRRTAARPRTVVRRRDARGPRELVLLGALFVAYSFTRLAAADDVGSAVHVASRVVGIEGFFGLDVERAVATWTSAHLAVAVVCSGFYAIAHYVVTATVLLHVWVRHPEHYRHVRDVLVVATLAALVVYLVLPTAPPRLLPGYPDILGQTAGWGWWGDAAPPGGGGITNQLAAMPSMHVGWAIWVALALRTCWQGVAARRLVWLYPVVTSLVVVATANHWVLDAVMGVVFVGLASAVVRQRSAPTSWAASSP